MRNWRVLTAIVAVVLAALVGVLIYKYADDAKNEAKKPYESLSVLVADRAIPQGTSFTSALDNGQLKRAERVRRDLPATRISGEPTDDILKKQFTALVSSHAIVPGQVIVSQDFVAQGDIQSSISGTLQTDQAKEKTRQLTAVTVTLADDNGVGGFLSPGDTVNVMVTMGVNKQHFICDRGEGGGGSAKLDPEQGICAKFTSYMLPGVKVLAVGNTTAAPQASASASTASTKSKRGSGSETTPTTTDRTVNRSLVTLEVDVKQATELVQAQAYGTLYAALNPPNFKAGAFHDPGQVVEAINLYDRALPQVDAALAAVGAR